MARVTICDICKKPTDEIVAKLFYAKALPGQSNGKKMPNYTMHLDVGVCCDGKLGKSFKWRPRMSAAEYNKSRRRNQAA